MNRYIKFVGIGLFIGICLYFLTGCAHTKPFYFNGSDKVAVDVNDNGKPIRVYCNEDGTTCTKTDFDLVTMSKAHYRTITTVNPTN